MGLPILPPDINASQTSFTVEGKGIRFGLSAIKGVGRAAVEPILVAREREGGFSSVAHCLRSVPSRALNHKVLECLVKAGSFDAFGVPRAALLGALEQLMDLTAREREQSELGQGFLFDDLMSETLEAELASGEAAPDAERLQWERDVLGFYLSGHPLDDHRDQLGLFADCAVENLPERMAAGAERVTIGGLVSGLKVMPIRKQGPNQGRRMAVWQLEDATGTVRVVAFPDAFERYERRLIDGAAVLVVASLKGEGDHVELSADEVAALDQIESQRAAALRLVLDLESLDEQGLEEIREYLLGHPGELPVRFELRRRGRFRVRLVPPPALTVDAGVATRDGLRQLLGGGWCEFEFDAAIRNGRNSANGLAKGPAGPVN
jgi:DNA polymerase-3 subunit alpha